jgi:hypothetical protein
VLPGPQRGAQRWQEEQQEHEQRLCIALTRRRPRSAHFKR